jgi:hypothetical protein
MDARACERWAMFALWAAVIVWGIWMSSVVVVFVAEDLAHAIARRS